LNLIHIHWNQGPFDPKEFCYSDPVSENPGFYFSDRNPKQEVRMHRLS
jgi:hypothetical protein